MTIGDLFTEVADAGITVEHANRRCHTYIKPDNGWVVSVGYCPHHYCSNRDFSDLSIDHMGLAKTRDEWATSPDAEVAIFRPDGSWFIPEGADDKHLSPGYTPSTWVGGWWSAERARDLIFYIAAQ
jgi:hypothetical protein